MKDSRFIELLNLYVDQQLSKEEAGELEREIASHPTRARTYQQYCRMQKACTLLFEQERVEAPNTGVLSKSLSDADRKIIAFPESRPSGFRAAALYGASLAAAACVAFAVVNRAEIARLGHPHSGIYSTTVANNAPITTSTATIAANKISAATPAVRRPEYFAVFSTRPSLTDESSGDLVVENQGEDRVSYEWMHAVELPPVSPLTADHLTLASTATTSEARGLRAVPASLQGSESAAFQFQR